MYTVEFFDDTSCDLDEKSMRMRWEQLLETFEPCLGHPLLSMTMATVHRLFSSFRFHTLKISGAAIFGNRQLKEECIEGLGYLAPGLSLLKEVKAVARGQTECIPLERSLVL